MGDYEAINLGAKLASFEDLFAPRVVAQLNDVQFKLAKLEGDFVWHRHDETDEAFIVLAGTLHIDFEDGSVTLSAGEMFVVPRGRAHRPRAPARCEVLLIEPAGTANTGDAGGELTSPGDVWI